MLDVTSIFGMEVISVPHCTWWSNGPEIQRSLVRIPVVCNIFRFMCVCMGLAGEYVTVAIIIKSKYVACEYRG